MASAILLECPTCNAKQDEPCRTPNGRIKKVVHNNRPFSLTIGQENMEKEKANIASLEKYCKLMLKFPLTPITTDEELKEAIKVVNGLLRSDLTKEESEYLEVLSLIIEEYEDKNIKIETPVFSAMLNHLLEAKGASLEDVSTATGIDYLALGSIVKDDYEYVPSIDICVSLGEYFNVNPTLFTDSAVQTLKMLKQPKN